jgi:subtilisin family serine protease
MQLLKESSASSPAVPRRAPRGSPFLAAALLAGIASAGCAAGPDLLDDAPEVPARVASGRAEPSGSGHRVSALSTPSSSELFSRIEASGGHALVGLRRPDRERGMWEAKRLIAEAEVELALQRLRAIPGVSVDYVDDVLPLAAVTLRDRAAFEALRALPFLDYLEPGRLDLEPQDSGCGSSAAPTWAPNRTSAGDIIPLVYPPNGVVGAWARGAQGQGVAVGIVDTGISRTQSELSPAAFSAVGRSITYHGCSTQSCLDGLAADQFDQCDHGTRIASIVGAPNNGRSIVGVAYRSNLLAEKGGDSVWSDDNLSALKHLAGIRVVRQEGARVIEMAFGGISYSNALADEISFEYNRSDLPEVLFVGAAGTAVCPTDAVQFVVFPASLPQVLAVTGVNYDGTREPSACTGKEVRLAAYLKDSESAAIPDGSVVTLGGTSLASAIAAGSAALVWSKYPTLSRAALIDRLIERSRPSKIGVPILDANKAAGGLMGVSIASTRARVHSYDSYSLSALPDGDGPFAYRWSNGETTQNVTRTGPGTFSVTVTDLVDGATATGSITVSSCITGCGAICGTLSDGCGGTLSCPCNPFACPAARPKCCEPGITSCRLCMARNQSCP